MTNTIKNKVREFVEASFLFREGREGLADGQSLLAEGLIDSTGILELVSFIEAEFGIIVEDQEIVPENLDSVNQIAAYVAGKTSGITAVAV